LAIGLTDITTSEGNLGRLGLICGIIAEARTLSQAKLYKIVKEQAGLSNPKVIGRHLHILKTLGLVAKKSEIYFATGRGKALSRLHKQGESILNESETTIFFKSFFASIPEQLYWLIHVVGSNEGASLSKNALQYFFSSPAKNIWVKTIESATRGETTRVLLTKGMLNKFDTMLYWLSQLRIVEKRKTVYLTQKGRHLFKILVGRNNLDFGSEIYYLCAMLYGNQEIQYFDFSKHRIDFINVLREGSHLFRSEQELSDLVAVQEFTSAVFAVSGIALEEKRFYEAIQELGLDGTIRSVIVGRDGKPAFLIMD
jgi:hypothetical protein